MSNIPNITGIICEFNPMHLGHAILIQKAREQGSTHITAVMSGNFVQRGEPACFDKWSRAQAALRCGADLVIELPLPWAIAGAETFALGGVSLLKAIGAYNIAFGSECGQSAPLHTLAKHLLSPDLNDEIQQCMRKQPGISYACARQQTVASLCGPEAAALLDSPNNILGVEYCKAIHRLGAPITPFTITRIGTSHDEGGTSRPGIPPSSSQLRRLLEENPAANLAPYLPPAAAEIFSREVTMGRGPVSMRTLETAILCRLRSLQLKECSLLPDISEGLENRLYQAIRKACSLEELYRLTKSKRYSHARIRRIVLSAFLGVTAADTRELPPYLRILAMNTRGAELLSFINAQESFPPILTKYAQVSSLPRRGQHLFALETRATDLFSLALPYPQPCGQDMFRGIIVETSS